MNALAPCPGCRRHVRTGALECPFCAAALDGIPVPKLPIQFGQHRRTALFFMGATIAALGASCSGDTGGSSDAGGGPIDEGGMGDIYGTPGFGGYPGVGGYGAVGGTAGTGGAAGAPIDDSGPAGAGGGPQDEGG